MNGGVDIFRQAGHDNLRRADRGATGRGLFGKVSRNESARPGRLKSGSESTGREKIRGSSWIPFSLGVQSHQMRVTSPLSRNGDLTLMLRLKLYQFRYAGSIADSGQFMHAGMNSRQRRHPPPWAGVANQSSGAETTSRRTRS
jgi:hypothetical protein